MAETNYSLKWNEFENMAANTFKDLVSDNNFSDVTLVCEDGEQINAHKIILSSCSSFFKTIFLKTKNQSQNLLIYLKSINSKDLRLMMRFIYLGEAQVNEANLQEFLEAGKDLKIDGLIDKICPIEESETIIAAPEPKPDPLEVNDEILLTEDFEAAFVKEAAVKDAVEKEADQIQDEIVNENQQLENIMTTLTLNN